MGYDSKESPAFHEAGDQAREHPPPQTVVMKYQLSKRLVLPSG